MGGGGGTVYRVQLLLEPTEVKEQEPEAKQFSALVQIFHQTDSRSMEGVVCAWLRNDLRLHDNSVLHQAGAMIELQFAYRRCPPNPKPSALHCFQLQKIEKARPDCELNRCCLPINGHLCGLLLCWLHGLSLKCCKKPCYN